MQKENTPQLETARLVLRKFTENDIQDILLIYGDTEVNKFLPWFLVKSIEEAREYLTKSIFPEYEKDTAYRYAIALKEGNHPIGYVSIGDIGNSNDIGYGLRKEFWNKGIMTEACTAIVDHLREVGFPFITATHDVLNPYSGEVMKKIGMTYHYSYDELVQPKNYMVTFRMYQLNFDETLPVYAEYQEKYPHFVEQV